MSGLFKQFVLSSISSSVFKIANHTLMELVIGLKPLIGLSLLVIIVLAGIKKMLGGR